MIAYIEGKLTHKEPSFVILDVNGVGYQIRISLNTYSAIPDVKSFKLYTYLQIKEDAHTLFGFADSLEKKVFLDLISVSGIGSNTALVILSSLSTNEVIQAIASEDVKTIQGIKGIGIKTAQRAIIELKDKIKKDNFDITSTASVGQYQTKQEALMALMALGIAKNVAEKNVETILKQKGTELKVEELIKLALKM